MMRLHLSIFWVIALLLTACGAAARPIIPTDLPTATISPTPSATPTPGIGASPTPRPPLAGPSPTSIFGPTWTPAPLTGTPTRVVNPNAPRIEFFTTDALSVAPGDSLTLFWSIRGARGAVIYRLDAAGARGSLWNVPPDGSLSVPTRRADRGQVTFLLTAGEGELAVERALTVPLLCPDTWFFQPAPDSCPQGPAEPSTLVEQPFEFGRLLYIQSRNRVYALFNDGRSPAWVSFDNRYDPAVHPEFDENFERVVPPGRFQPLRVLGFVWRGSDVVRSRLGLGLQPETAYEGFVQVVTSDGAENLYLSSVDQTVLRLLPGGDLWEIITPPR